MIMEEHRHGRAHPTEEEVRTAEAGLQRVREDLAKRRNDLLNLESSKVRIHALWSNCNDFISGARRNPKPSQIGCIVHFHRSRAAVCIAPDGYFERAMH